jgi:hypothetical protein
MEDCWHVLFVAYLGGRFWSIGELVDEHDFCLECPASIIVAVSLIAMLPNQALHRTAIPLRSIAAGELGRSKSP